MMVIADTGPINYLISIGHINVLPKLYSMVSIPSAVRGEWRDAAAPDLVRRWIDSPPEWLEIRQPTLLPGIELLRIRIGRGGADDIIVDDQLGRREAERRKLHTVGTVASRRLRRPFSGR
jgi:predicted nucleic acid-binding protein